ncbi:unnamed protein product [Ceutorhynchus assimilis]|uniref:THAP-type domain-containing protein n=1 Tax=Ceutorhynchus assimilis TaxID=467358 RepID=A0A9N9MUA4_9CUCU|nr:unnamed protein product [Ceutorhynchus assimilis]
MPGIYCAVAYCNNHHIRKADKNYSFFTFPKDQEYRRLWIEKCQRSGEWTPENSRICSEHFTEDDFVRNLQAEFLKVKAKRKLKSTAIPSRNLHPMVENGNLRVKALIKETSSNSSPSACSPTSNQDSQEKNL